MSDDVTAPGRAQDLFGVEDHEIEGTLLLDRPVMEYSKQDLAAALVWQQKQFSETREQYKRDLDTLVPA